VVELRNDHWPLWTTSSHQARFQLADHRPSAGMRPRVRLDSGQPSSTEVFMPLIGLPIALALTLGLTLAPIVAETQQARKVWRIGVLAPKEGSALLVDVDGVRRGLKEFGYIEGKNLVIEARGSSRYEELGHAAVEVARLKPDVIVAIAAAAYPAKAATQTIPI